MLALEDVRQAYERIRNEIYYSPCPRAHKISQRFSCNLSLKLENLQRTGSFKERGAANKLEVLSEHERSTGVITASAGNHAQAVAFHAKRLGIKATIVMPRTTPLIKVSATSALGAEVILEGSGYDQAFRHALSLAQQLGLYFVHPFDDEMVIAGQGTVALEILEQIPDVEVVVCSVGGGGLLAGLVTVFRALKPSVKIYGVEPGVIPSLTAAIKADEPVFVDAQKSIADGTAVARVGDKTFEILKNQLDDVVTVDEERIAEAILLLIEDEKRVVEGAGALPIAGLGLGQLPIEGKRVVAIVSGGNIDVHIVARIIDRGLTQSGRQIRMRVRLLDVPGALASLLGVIGKQGANVLQINHDRVASRIALGQAAVDILLETRGFGHVREVENAIVEAGFTVSQ